MFSSAASLSRPPSSSFASSPLPDSYYADGEACGAASMEDAPAAAWRPLCGGHWSIGSEEARVRWEEVLTGEEEAAEELDAG